MYVCVHSHLQLSNKIVGIAPVEGTLNFSPCQPTNKVVVYEIHGACYTHSTQHAAQRTHTQHAHTTRLTFPPLPCKGTADPTVRYNGGSDCLNNAVRSEELLHCTAPTHTHTHT